MEAEPSHVSQGNDAADPELGIAHHAAAGGQETAALLEHGGVGHCLGLADAVDLPLGVNDTLRGTAAEAAAQDLRETRGGQCLQPIARWRCPGTADHGLLAG